VAYIKPVQTGFPHDSDGRLVARVAQCQHSLGLHAQACDPQGASHVPALAASAPRGVARTLFAWRNSVSPHLAVQHEGRGVTDSEQERAIATELHMALERFRGGLRGSVALVETAGGVCSPTPSGSLQVLPCHIPRFRHSPQTVNHAAPHHFVHWIASNNCDQCKRDFPCCPASNVPTCPSMQVDALSGLRLPALLLADCRLGGISTTVSAYESLLSRGYDVPAIVGLTPTTALTAGSEAAALPALDNLEIIAKHCASGPCQPSPRVFNLPACAPPPPNSDDCGSGIDVALAEWLQIAAEDLTLLHHHLVEWHRLRRERLESLGKTAQRVLWWPFTQHATMHDSDVTVIDSRAGESFAALHAHPSSSGADSAPSTNPPLPARINRMYDGCASWWTQGVSVDRQPLVRQHIAYAAGRYSHVIFPEVAHEPAVRLGEDLCNTVGRGWASRVFFSDDGCGLQVRSRLCLFVLSQSPQVVCLHVVMQTTK
jgi:bifunctional dethiobiotin synthetase / adenosylmethionine---8-amino-7-oxononanoate aminotransferase